MRDRLIELLRRPLPVMERDTTIGERRLPYLWAEKLADHLLANGVTVPPVSIGDSLWTIYRNKPREWKVIYLGFNGKGWHINVHWSNKEGFVTREVDGKDLDRIFFRTKEEAEQALKERE